MIRSAMRDKNWISIGMTVIVLLAGQHSWNTVFSVPVVDTASAASARWTPLGSPVKASQSNYVEVDSSKHALDPTLVINRSVPYLGWTEPNSHGISQVYVRHWNGLSWIKDGSSLNQDEDHRAFDLSISSDGEALSMAWIELNNKGIPQLYVKRLIGNDWIEDGKGLNRDRDQAAANPALAVSQSAAYLAWTERNAQRVFQLYVKRRSNGLWQLDGDGSLNLPPSRDAVHPAIVINASDPYITWMQLSDEGFYQIHVKRREASGWNSMGGGLNMDPHSHAMNPSIVLDGHTPYIAWTEINPEGISQLYMKGWSEGKWESIGGSLNLDPARHATKPALLQAGPDLYLAWAEPNAEGISKIHVKRRTRGGWERLDSYLNSAGLRTAVSPSIAGSDSGLFISRKEINRNGLFQIIVKKRTR